MTAAMWMSEADAEGAEAEVIRAADFRCDRELRLVIEAARNEGARTCRGMVKGEAGATVPAPQCRRLGGIIVTTGRC
jgi:hypothetical protein